MTRRAKHSSATASIVALLFVDACMGASAQPPAPLDLSNLEFAPSLPAGAAPRDAELPSPEPDRSPQSSARSRAQLLALTADIAAEQARNGAFSAGLIYYLPSLAALHQELGDHVAAIAVLERTRQIVRVNSGLSSIDQADLLLQRIASFEAIGSHDLAAQDRNSLIELARENPTDLRVAKIYATVADARFAAVERWLADPSQRPIIFGSGGGDDNFSALALAGIGLASAQANYVEALRATAINGSPGGPSVYALEDALMRTYYVQAKHWRVFFASEMTPYRIRKALDAVGASSYERRVKYSTLFERPPTEIASYLIELGDWHLLFRQDEAADAAYRQALGMLIDAGVSDSEIDALFTPRTPLLIPVFMPQLVAAADVPEYQGHFDVAIELDGFGRSEDVRITGQSGAPSSTIAARLRRHIAKAQFRPRFVNGERAHEHQVALRYYFKY